MAIEPINKVTGTGVYVSGDDIDTDRIIPARFMRCVTFDGLGEYAFYDVRFNADGSPTPHVLNDARFKGASILISDDNFGCGSSREHAPQALAKFGFRAIIAGSFAEIFFGNCTTLGIPCVMMPAGKRAELAEMIDADPETVITVDLDEQAVSAGDKTFPVEIRDSARLALVAGKYDPLFELLSAEDDVRKLAESLGYV